MTMPSPNRVLTGIPAGALLSGLAVAGYLAGIVVSGNTRGGVEVMPAPTAIVRDSVVLATETVALLEHSSVHAARGMRPFQLAVVLARKAIVIGDDDLGRQLRELVRTRPESVAVVVLADIADSAAVAYFLRRERLSLPMITVDLRTLLTSNSTPLGMPSVLAFARGDHSALMLRPLGNESGVRMQSYATALGYTE